MLATWLRQPTSPEFRKYITLITEYALAQHITTALFDVRQRAYMEFADQNWSLTEVFPLLEGKPRKLAYLTKLEGLDLMDTLRLQESLDTAAPRKKGLLIEHFLEQEQAMEWLLN